MEINLRKANALSKALLDAARALPLNRQVKVSAYSTATVANEVSSAQEKLVANAAKAGALIAASYKLRDQIGILNAANNITGLLTEKACLDATEKLLAPLATARSDISFEEETVDTTVAQAQLDAIKARLTAGADANISRFGQREDSVTVLASVPGVSERLITIRRRKVEIADELLRLNMTAKISVSTEVEALLTEFNLI